MNKRKFTAFFMSIIAKNYVAIKVDKIFDPTARGYEILNLLNLKIDKRLVRLQGRMEG